MKEMREVFARLEAQGYPRERQEVSVCLLPSCQDFCVWGQGCAGTVTHCLYVCVLLCGEVSLMMSMTCHRTMHSMQADVHKKH